ncbi:MAG: protoporphyrinogen oxidase [Candidatus Nanopelagicales bacterium]|nr:protoporphyrinogen oxidase [Candidatus Nanopelagicales bacterium]
MTAKQPSGDPGAAAGLPGDAPEPGAGAHVVVVGGGITGLAAAWYLIRSHPHLNVTVLEATPTLGGKLAVSDVAGIAVDEGAESFVASRPEALQLAREVGLETELVAPTAFHASVYSRGRVRAMPRGQFMGVPTDLRALAASELISMPGLMRVPLDRTLPATELAEDVSVGDLVAARVGREVVDRMVEPLLGGVYAGRADELSMAATMPALFREMRHERSLLTATRRIAGGGMQAAGARRGIPFRGIVGGVGRVPGAMAAALVGSGVQIRTRTTARALRRVTGGWEVELGPAPSPEMVRADAVVVATPAAPAARLIADVAPAAAMELSEIETASVALITLAFRSVDLQAPLAGSGLLVPPVEGRMVKAVTYLDQKWGWLGEAAQREGVRLLRLSLGRHGEPEVLQRSDEELVALARLDLALLLGIRGIPVDTRVSRWGGALPQYAVGHRRRVERITLGLRDVPTLALAGATYEGVGVAACVATAYEAASRVARGLALQPAASRA